MSKSPQPSKTKTSKTTAQTNNSHASLLLIFQTHQDQQQQTLSFLETNQGLDTAQPQPNLHWLNQDNEGVKIKAVRELLNQASYGSYNQQRQFFIILQAEQSSIPAQNALLKIVEEPPKNSQLILTTARPELILPTIHSRCRIINLSRLAPQQQFSPDIIQVAQIITGSNFKFPQAIELAEKHKNRDQAVQFISDLISYLHQQLNTQQSTQSLDPFQLSSIITHLLQAYQDINNNLNVRLALEHCCFQIVAKNT